MTVTEKLMHKVACNNRLKKLASAKAIVKASGVKKSIDLAGLSRSVNQVIGRGSRPLIPAAIGAGSGAVVGGLTSDDGMLSGAARGAAIGGATGGAAGLVSKYTNPLIQRSARIARLAKAKFPGATAEEMGTIVNKRKELVPEVLKARTTKQNLRLAGPPEMNASMAVPGAEGARMETAASVRTELMKRASVLLRAKKSL